MSRAFIARPSHCFQNPVAPSCRETRRCLGSLCWALSPGLPAGKSKSQTLLRGPSALAFRSTNGPERRAILFTPKICRSVATCVKHNCVLQREDFFLLTLSFLKGLDERQGRRGQHWWKVLGLRWEATHPSNPGGTCSGSVWPDESGSSVVGREETLTT